MTRYEKYGQIDGMVDLIYDSLQMDDVYCGSSPLRVNGNCPVNEDEICKENCSKCVRAWLETNVSDKEEN